MTPAEHTWTSVSLPYVTGDPGRAWADEARSHGQCGTQQLRDVAEVLPPPQVAAALGTPPGDTVVVRSRIMLLQDTPVELTDSYYPATIALGTQLAEPRPIRGGAARLLVHSGHAPSHIREDVTTRPPTSDEQRLLALDDGAWVLELLRLSTTGDGRPVEVSVMTMVATGRRLRYQMTLPDTRRDENPREPHA